jgi:hypothetical protein
MTTFSAGHEQEAAEIVPNAHRIKGTSGRVVRPGGGRGKPTTTPKPPPAQLPEERAALIKQHETLEALGHRDWEFCNCSVAALIRWRRIRK